MITIFDGFEKLSDDEIRGQIALLQCMTLSNTVKEVVQFGRVRKMVDEAYNSLMEMEREELDIRLKQELIKKYQSLTGTILSEEVSEDELHVRIVREAARVYLVADDKTPGQKADEIHEKYYEHYLKVLQKKLSRMTLEECEKMDMQIQKAVMKADILEMRRLAGEMMLREFNGKAIRMRITAENGTAMLKKVIQTIGLGIFDGIEGVINTAHDSVLMFCRMERAILAQCVWTAVNGYGKRMTLPSDLMPSYSNGLQQEENDKERLLLQLIAKEAELNRILKKQLSEIDKNNKQLYIKEESQARDREKLETAKEELEKVLEEKEVILSEGEIVKYAYEEYIRNNSVKNNSDVEYRRLKQNYEDLARSVRNNELKTATLKKNITRLEENLKNLENQIADTNRKLKELREELISNVNEFNEVITLLENEAGYRGQVLKRKWNAFYKKLEFDGKIYESVVKLFTQREIVAIERMLKEMDDCDAMEVFSLTRNHPAVNCQVGGGKAARILFEENRILEIQVKGRTS